MSNPFRDNGFELPIGPPRIDFARNSYAYQYDPKITPKKSAIDHMIEAFKASFKPQPKRQPIVTLRSGMTYYRDSFGYKWNWTCRLCYRTSGAAYWDLAYESATHHARNHHGK